MQAIKFIKKVKNGKASIEHIPEEFGSEVEIIVLPVRERSSKKASGQKSRILDLVGKTNIPPTIYTELDNDRQEERI
jgi:hypothetical protein